MADVQTDMLMVMVVAHSLMRVNISQTIQNIHDVLPHCQDRYAIKVEKCLDFCIRTSDLPFGKTYDIIHCVSKTLLVYIQYKQISTLNPILLPNRSLGHNEPHRASFTPSKLMHEASN